MKIVQTFWSGGRTMPELFAYGWNSPECHLIGWALSSCLLRRYYDELVLFTDKAGKALLIEKLGLPYTEVHEELDCLNHYHPDLWALSKIYTYSRQREPFLHVDADVFLWEPFSTELLSSDLIAQNLENGGAEYRTVFDSLSDSICYFPEALQAQNGRDIYTYNAGIFGGSDLEFFREYCQEAFHFVDQNLECLDDTYKASFNIFFEQFLFYCKVQQHRRQVSCLFPELFENILYHGFADFEEVPYARKYLHLVCEYKKKEKVTRLMELQLRQEFPETYLKLLRFFESRQLLTTPSGTSSACFQYLLHTENGKAGEARAVDTDFLYNVDILKRDLQSHRSYASLFAEGLEGFMSAVIGAVSGIEVKQAVSQPTLAGSQEDGSERGLLALLPEYNHQQTEVDIDELDREILTVLSQPMAGRGLLNALSKYFEGESPGTFSLDFLNLISGRVKSLISERLITHYPTNI